MTIAARLDRLRRQSPPEQDPLVSRLQRLRRSRRAPAAPPVLAAALGADTEVNGLLIRVREAPLPPHAGERSALVGLPEVHDLQAPDWVYIDTETTGLSAGVGNLAFMVGVARHRSDGKLEVRQYVLAAFAAEGEMLRQLVAWIGGEAVLVSYNGKCFDVPVLAARLRLHRIAESLGDLRHLDLMYSVRRAYRDRWPDCRLQTAEKRLLGLSRVGDLPGAEAPLAWRSWLERGVTPPLQAALQHNFQDVASLVLLHRQLVPRYAGGAGDELNHGAIARAWHQAGCLQQACTVLESAGGSLDEAGRLQLADLYRQRGAWSDAETLWLDLHAQGNVAAALALSKYYEHRRRDYRRAIAFARDCAEAERRVRCGRLLGKVGGNLQLPLWGSGVELSR